MKYVFAAADKLGLSFCVGAYMGLRDSCQEDWSTQVLMGSGMGNLLVSQCLLSEECPASSLITFCETNQEYMLMQNVCNWIQNRWPLDFLIDAQLFKGAQLKRAGLTPVVVLTGLQHHKSCFQWSPVLTRRSIPLSDTLSMAKLVTSISVHVADSLFLPNDVPLSSSVFVDPFAQRALLRDADKGEVVIVDGVTQFGAYAKQSVEVKASIQSQSLLARMTGARIIHAADENNDLFLRQLSKEVTAQDTRFTSGNAWVVNMVNLGYVKAFPKCKRLPFPECDAYNVSSLLLH
jgi:hypothetical protein